MSSFVMIVFCNCRARRSHRTTSTVVEGKNERLCTPLCFIVSVMAEGEEANGEVLVEWVGRSSHSWISLIGRTKNEEMVEDFTLQNTVVSQIALLNRQCWRQANLGISWIDKSIFRMCWFLAVYNEGKEMLKDNRHLISQWKGITIGHCIKDQWNETLWSILSGWTKWNGRQYRRWDWLEGTHYS